MELPLAIATKISREIDHLRLDRLDGSADIRLHIPTDSIKHERFLLQYSAQIL